MNRRRGSSLCTRSANAFALLILSLGARIAGRKLPLHRHRIHITGVGRVVVESLHLSAPARDVSTNRSAELFSKSTERFWEGQLLTTPWKSGPFRAAFRAANFVALPGLWLSSRAPRSPASEERLSRRGTPLFHGALQGFSPCRDPPVNKRTLAPEGLDSPTLNSSQRLMQVLVPAMSEFPRTKRATRARCCEPAG